MKTYHAGVYACTLGNEGRCGDARGNAKKQRYTWITIIQPLMEGEGGWECFFFFFKSYFASVEMMYTETHCYIMSMTVCWKADAFDGFSQQTGNRVIDREHQEVSPGTAGWCKVISIQLIPLNTWAAAVKYYIILELQLWNTTSYLSYSCEILHHIWAAAVKYYIIFELQLWNTTSYLSYSCEILHHTWATAVKYYIIFELQLWNTTSYLSYSCEILHHTWATAVKYYIICLLQLWNTTSYTCYSCEVLLYIAWHKCCDITIYCLKHSCKVYTLIA